MEAVKAAPSSQGPLRPEPLRTRSAGTPDEGRPACPLGPPAPFEAKDPLEWAQWDRVARGADDAAGRYPAVASALQPLQELPRPRIGTIARQDRV